MKGAFCGLMGLTGLCVEVLSGNLEPVVLLLFAAMMGLPVAVRAGSNPEPDDEPEPTELERQVWALAEGLPDLRAKYQEELRAAEEAREPALQIYRGLTAAVDQGVAQVRRQPQSVGLWQIMLSTFTAFSVPIARALEQAECRVTLGKLIEQESGFHVQASYTHKGQCTMCRRTEVLRGNGLCSVCHARPPDDWPWLRVKLRAESVELKPTSKDGWLSLYVRKRKPGGGLTSVHMLVDTSSLRSKTFRDSHLLRDLERELLIRGCKISGCVKCGDDGWPVSAITLWCPRCTRGEPVAELPDPGIIERL